MLDQIKAHFLHILAIAYATALPYLNAKLGLHLTDNHIHGVQGLCGMLMAAIWHKGIIQAKAAQLLKVAPLLMLAIGLAGCALSPAQIEADTAMGTNLGLTGAVIFDKAKVVEIQADAVQVAQAINQAVLPQFQPSSTASGLLNSAVSQALPHLQVRLSSLKHGPEILAAIALLQGPLSGALGMTASPTAALSPAAQLNALAFFSGVSQGIATFTGNASLAPPPLPTAPVAPVAPPSPPTAPK